MSGENVKKLKVYSGEFQPALHQAELGSMTTVDRRLGVAVPGGYYFIEELQLAGKRRMKIGDFLNGIQPGPDDHLK
jgi:methionyl-tRNA formyltransferase